MAETAAITAPGTALLAGNAKPLLVVDDECVCVEASLGACRMLGAGRDEIVGHPVEELLEPGSRERFDHVWHAFRATGGHAEPFALEAPATVVDVGVTVTAAVLPERHLITIDPARVRGSEAAAAGREALGLNGNDPISGGRGPTPRETQVLGLLAGGSTDVQIARRLGLSPATVQTHVRNAKAKLGARTRAQAVAMALRRGLISAG